MGVNTILVMVVPLTLPASKNSDVFLVFAAYRPLAYRQVLTPVMEAFHMRFVTGMTRTGPLVASVIGDLTW